MVFSKEISVIIPVWRGAIKFLPKLFDTIPDKDGIEIIVIDNSEDPVLREEIISDREIVFLHSAHDRHAGGSRNEGLKVANGKWIIFADSDDYFTSEAFDVFYSMINVDAEIIFTVPTGIYEDTGEYSNRAEKYANMVHDYCNGIVSDDGLRYHFPTPWCKMISHDLVNRYQLRFDEIRAGNDSYFSLLSGFYATKIDAVDKVTYVVTVNKGSLTQLRNYETTQARLFSKLHCNQFLRKHGLGRHQHSVMVHLYESRKYSMLKILKLLSMIIKFRQNPFVGWHHWRKTLSRVNAISNRDSKYRVH